MYRGDPVAYYINCKFTVIQQEIPAQNIIIAYPFIGIIRIIAAIVYVASNRRSKSSEAR
ncbi:MAG TPA: hypothetical protein VKM55_30175 [Candidatus Lokiarchaeia archaeon]|nr:hypothetical protein [Candidatus Lokiarchaeia archaeon]